MKHLIIGLLLTSLISCGQAQDNTSNENQPFQDSLDYESIEIANCDTCMTLSSRFITPQGYKRIEVPEGSFQSYLRSLPLKKSDARVKYYDGAEKMNYGVYAAVVDLEIGHKNLHQCADAIMRLRAAYLWENKQYESIHFNFTNGFNANYEKWMQGNRISVKNNQVSWYKSTTPSNTYKTFWQYLEMVFSYAGTLSLSKEMQSKSIDAMKIGDVFIRGGSPGHAIIIVDMAMNEDGDIKFMLAQSYMPAQELQILCNPNLENSSTWYDINSNGILSTPEWTFEYSELKQFVE